MQLAKVPKLAIYTTQKQLKQGRLANRAAFERVFRKDGLLFRYYADRPCYCVGEYVLSNPSFVQHKSYLFLQQIHANAWYALHVDNGKVKKEYLQPLDASFTALSYDALKVDVVLVATDNSEDMALIADAWAVPTVMALPITFDIGVLGKYELINLKSRERLLIAGFCVVAVTIATVFLIPEAEKKDTVSPWAAWHSTPQMDASINLHRLVAALSELYLLPADYQLGTIELPAGSDTLKFNILKTTADNARKEHFGAWLDSVPELSKYVDVASSTVNLPLIPARKAGVVQYDSLPSEFHDAMLQFGANSVVIEPSIPTSSPVQHTRVTVKWNSVDFTLLSYIAEYTQSQPIFLESISLDESKTPGVLGTASIVFIVEVLP